MSQVTGINAFYNTLALETGDFAVLYPYNDGAGTNVASVSGGQSEYNGTLSSAATFWPAPGSGFYSGTILTVNNASGAHSESWTKIFTYEQTQTGKLVLFDSLTGGSGCRIGVTDSNRLYFESFNSEPIVAASYINLSSKNAVAVSYLTNYVEFSYLNFNSQQMVSDAYSYPFEATRSDNWRLGGGAPYYSDLFVHLNSFQSPQVIGQLLSGLYAVPTGHIYETTTICTTGITGYVNVLVGETGVTGYSISPGGDEGRDYYTGAFPTSHTTSLLTGYLSSGIYASGLTGLSCSTTTGDLIPAYLYLTGYASSFGMNKVQLFTPLLSTDIVKAGFSYVPFSDIYNEPTVPQFSGYQMANEYPTGLLNVYYNGVAQGGSGWVVTGTYLFVSGAPVNSAIWLDLKSGSKRSYPVNGQTGFAFVYSGQEIYLNGINLVSGYDYISTGNGISLLAPSTGVGGDIFEIPIVLANTTGNFTVLTTSPFWRDTSAVYLNGVRQQEDSLYVEGGVFDLLSGQRFSYQNVENIYDDNDLFWE
jgi:hypothetical protein